MDERKKRKKQPDVVDLHEYREKRNFERTGEPRGGERKSSFAPIFVIQKHAARRLHYDLRLEAEGALKSWAVPRGLSYDPGEKRLAVHVEDHPLEYADFEGLIAEHQYGAGTVMVWDRGTWTPVGDWKKGLEKGHLKFRLNGEKLKGIWSLVRIQGVKNDEFEETSHDDWLVIKAPDDEAKRLHDYDVTEREPLSVKTGRTMEAIQSQKTAFWDTEQEPGAQKAFREKTPAPPPVQGTEAPWPDSFLPQLATLVTRLPEGAGWVSEIKYDGYRLIAWIRDGKVTLTTRRGQNWTEKFAPIARELSRLPIRNALLDGEVVVLNSDGTTNFQKLQNILKHRDQGSLFYYAFDIPYYQDHDITGLRLLERKNLLRELIVTYRERLPSVRFSEHLEESGERVLHAACEHGVEGIVAKKADSTYAQRRTRSWVKRKCINRQEFVIGGYTEPQASRSFFGSLLLGFYNDENKLIYCGNVGTGFSFDILRQVYDNLKELEQDKSPFDSPVDDGRNREAHWVKPLLVAEIEFSDWTEGNHLRHPSFIGLREDKKAEEVKRESETVPVDETADGEVNPSSSPLTVREGRVGLLPIKLTNPERVFYPDAGITKKDLAEYYMQVAPWMLPELANRPLVLVRCPEGISQVMRENCFFQKHLRDEIPESLRTAPIEEKGTIGLYPVLDDVKGLLSLAQLGVLEIHMLGSRADDVNHPDRMIFDLDPAPEVSKGRLIEAARFISNWLGANNMRPFLKLTGGKGIHIVVPINPSLTWDEVKRLSNAVAVNITRRKPSWFVTTVSKRRRTGKILIDYLRNSLGASSIVPYSTRALPGAPVAFPISAVELTEELLSRPITMRDAMDRVRKRKEDPWRTITSYE